MPDVGATVNIRPGVSILSVLRHLNYKPWFAMAEFVDNSVQSFLDHRAELDAAAGSPSQVNLTIELDDDGRRITVRDDAAGIHEKDFERAFRPAALPPDRSGLAEFGMGMKSAACWFAPHWSVRTSGIGEPNERTIAFDIDRIVRDDLQELDVRVSPAPAEAHYTEIVLNDVYHPLRGRTMGKVREHLASIYRIFIRRGILVLTFAGQPLAYQDPEVLVAPPFREPNAEARRWFKTIDLDFGGEQRAHGFAALRRVGSTAEAGFALFRRDRLIQGSADEAYRPATIFGASNSFTYQRLFGELHLEGFEVSHTKDGFQWADHEDTVLEFLKVELETPPLPLLSQAEGHRTGRVRGEDVVSGGKVAVERTGGALEREAPPVLERQLEDAPTVADTPVVLPAAPLASHRTIPLEIDGQPWEVELELSTDPAVGDWVYLSDMPTAAAEGRPRRIGVRLAMAHPFMVRFGGTSPDQIEPLLRLAVALVLAEVTAREAGVELAGAIRRRMNELLRDVLSKP